MTPTLASTRYHLLDPLRGLSAVWVFLYHFHYSEEFHAQFTGFIAFAEAGHFGVPIFFVISGYCIAASASSSLRRNEPTAQFLKRRVRRIYPTFWASLVCAIALPFVLEGLSFLKTGVYQAPHPAFLDYDGWQWLRVATLTQVFYPVNGIQFLQDKFNTINAVYWSLAIEEQFYLVMAFALALGTRHLLVIALVTAISVPFFFDDGSYVTGLFLAYWPMFFLGMALFYAFQAKFEPQRLFGRWAKLMAMIMFSLGIPGALIVVRVYDLRLSHFSFAFATVVLLWFARAFDARFHELCRSPHKGIAWATRGLALVGAMSYTIYLMHAKFMFLADTFVRQILSESPITRNLCVFVVTLVLCYPFYLVFEKPFVGNRRPKTRDTQPLLQPAAASSTAEPIVQPN